MKKFIPAARIHLLTPLFDFLCTLFGFGKKYRLKIIDNIDIEKGKVLDAGCGTGAVAKELKEIKPKLEIYGIDPDKRILEIARKKTKDINFQEAFMQKLPFPDNYFDFVYSSLVVHHIQSEVKQDAMNEIYRVLKPKGKFLLVDFGKPKNKFFAIPCLYAMILEEGIDNYKGKIPEILKKAKFKSVEKIDEYSHNVHLLLAEK